MSRHRMKNVNYDDEDFDDGYDSPDPEEQEILEQCTAEVLAQLISGEPSVTATRDEVQEALWHYYNDVEKSVNYLRGKKAKEIQKKQNTPAPAPATAAKAKVPAYPLPPTTAPLSSHFSARDFFRDSPWLNVPAHRKAEILIEPLYPRLGLLGGAPESSGKMSKLAALAAARKKKEGDKATPAPSTPAVVDTPEKPPVESKLASLSLRERLAGSGKTQKPSDARQPLRTLGRGARLEKPVTEKKPSPEPSKPQSPEVTEVQSAKEPLAHELEQEQPKVDIRAPPSTFASIIVGNATRSGSTKPSHLHSNTVDLMKIYGQDLTEPFDFAGPSPDDVVLNAQSSAKGFKSKQPASKSAGDKKNQGDLAGGLSNLSVEEKVNVKSKNLDVLSEYSKAQRKRAMNFAVIGHVDAGKSTLMGRLLADLKAIDQRTLEKYQREAEKIGKGSFALAWVLDQGTEERARGVTIDIATNKFETAKTVFTIVDAPGHRDFVPNMIAGASQADFAVLVIDSSTGNFESGLRGQTKEHALLVRSMGVQRIIIAVNKMDAVDWSRDRFEEIEQQISSFLTTAGFQAKNIAFVPCSGFRGDNVTGRSEDPNASWYTGPTLIDELEAAEPSSYALDKPLRMTIGDVFRGSVQNPLSISGRIDAGSLQIGDQILTMPSGETATIRSLEVDGEPSDWAVAGQNVVLNLANIDPIHLRSGDVICRALAPIANVTSFTAKVLAFEHLMPSMVDIHRGRLHVPGRISRLVATLDKGSGAVIKKKPKIVAPGTVARVVVEMDQAVPLEAPTRIVLRSGGETVAAGLLE
ncbi:putative translation elongation factor EF-1 subunit [Aspergillus clavatus NRRL 1]|uniref:Elongation factor 1 alpha-like protein n=1 Tax=Aspergillus clavatus (strain ATCC 1007 / CBS 513.65 / DSM 816 / NCTC 3887 / NRRL 1 / QM 1276 / 107) TaxID=344612 RepID=A1CEK8_ASPCL|nr:elongation factor Tu GTP binding domain protein [Aspergillus clavatus NRRL 1]EAW11307.1 elongation factor Tu GTP binding domain protein [Aspergillus clavatus NRRL 1]